MESTLEVLTTRKSGREIHRHWPDEVKAQIGKSATARTARSALSDPVGMAGLPDLADKRAILPVVPHEAS